MPVRGLNSGPFAGNPPGALNLLVISIGWGALAFFICVGAQWMIYEHLLHDAGGMRIVSPAIAAIVAGVLDFRLQMAMRERRLAGLRRYRVIADMNHHIRNALQVISYQAYVSDRAATERMRQAVDRIDWALREVLPSMETDKLDSDRNASNSVGTGHQ